MYLISIFTSKWKQHIYFCIPSGKFKMRVQNIFFIVLTTILNRCFCINLDYKNHVCKRRCDGIPMECNYEINLDRYLTMQPDCGNCTTGQSRDCDNKYCILGDGNSRAVLVFNGMSPGPTIEVCHGDIIVVNFTNRLFTEATTIHWHGIHHQSSKNMDGVPMVTQCPILPHHNYTYRFIATQPGTHFYHTHMGTQRTDGAYAALIVREDPSNLLVSDTEHLLMFADWYRELSETISYTYYRNKIFYGNQPKSLLINGVAANSTNKLLPKKFIVEKNKLYRFRLVNSANVACPVEICIESHKLVAFNSDGHNFSPVEVDTISLANGERYDFILNADKAIAQYAIIVEGTDACRGTSALAILEYRGAAPRQIDFDIPIPNTGRRLNCITNLDRGTCIQLGDLQSETCYMLQDKVPDYKFFVFDLYRLPKHQFDGVNPEGILTPYANKIQYIPAERPLLQVPNQKTCNNETIRGPECEFGFCHCTHVVEIPNNKYVEFIFYDQGQIANTIHPIHLHGCSFAVMAQGILPDNATEATLKTLYETGRIQKKLISPVLKDTIVIHRKGYAVVRIFSSNMGFWLLHCHLDFHSELGMQVVIKTARTPRAANVMC